MKYCRNKGYGIVHPQTVWRRNSEIWPNKLEVAKSMKMCIGRITSVEV